MGADQNREENQVYLRRKIDDFLSEWKAAPDRKPLIIKGSRQVGKTESVLHFATDHYESIIEINFVRDGKYKGIISDGYFRRQKKDDMKKTETHMSDQPNNSAALAAKRSPNVTKLSI